MTSTSFSDRVLAWFEQHGRKDLPWQHNPTPYRVWVSEIMLQQTQVATVIDYYQRFMAQLPTIEALAKASEDDVLHLWTGLGYYARARNLHKTAKIVVNDFGGEFPIGVAALEQLPGIGRSTAGAITALSQHQWAAILDGNVKRVLARHAAIEGWPGQAATLDALWKLATDRTPPEKTAEYTQAMMDLGATLCTRSKPACVICPVTEDCQARMENRIDAFPGKKPKKEKPVKSTQMLMIENQHGEVFLEKRPSQGIWGGLWSFPELAAEQDPSVLMHSRLGLSQENTLETRSWPELRHTFSHYHLDIQPKHIKVEAHSSLADGQQLWYKPGQHNLGLAAPVNKLLDALFN